MSSAACLDSIGADRGGLGRPLARSWISEGNQAPQLLDALAALAGWATILLGIGSLVS